MKNIVKNKTRNAISDHSLDELIVDAMLNKTLGDITLSAVECPNGKTHSVATLIYNAIYGSVEEANQEIINPDITVIKDLITRIDGGAPEADEKDLYAGLVGETLRQILDGEIENEGINLDDLCIIALAKAIIGLANNPKKPNNQLEKKTRQMAIDILLTRVGGKKSAPEKRTIKLKYKEPDGALPNKDNKYIDDSTTRNLLDS